MSVRKRTWITAKGEPREAWIITYTDATAIAVRKPSPKRK
jgi:hypothetical protein